MMAGILLGVIDVTAMIFWVLRLAAGVGGALIGWFSTGPLARIMYRVVFRRPVPGWLLPWARLGGAALAGLLLFYFLPLGGGSGFGWGPGAGGGPGRGPDKGSEKAADGQAARDQKRTGDKPVTHREALEIELVGGPLYRGDGRFYLINRRAPAVALEEVEGYLKSHQDRLAEYVTIVLTPTSVDAGHRAVLRLNTIIEKYDRKPQLKDVGPQPRE
jgi:hypothetical protein